MPRRCPKRLPAFPYVGYCAYFVTILSAPRRPVFLTAAVVEPVASQLKRLARKEGFALSAWCFMPDHFHVLVEGQNEGADFRRFAKTFKQESAHFFRRTTGENLWASGYFEHILRSDGAVTVIARYILENPVRAGLVGPIEEYPFSGSEVWTISEIVAEIQML